MAEFHRFIRSLMIRHIFQFQIEYSQSRHVKDVFFRNEDEKSNKINGAI